MNKIKEHEFTTDDLCGSRFGKLLVIEKNKTSRNGGCSWVCRCECGRDCVVGGKALANKTKTNCGKCNYGCYTSYSEYAICELPDKTKFIIDMEDYPLVSQYKWTQTPRGYFVSAMGKRGGHTFLHRLVMKHYDLKENEFIDHIDCDKTNCRKSNLRICKKTDNNRNILIQKNNQCGYKGVHWAKDRRKWRADITVNRQHIHIGSYDTAEEAALAYDECAVLYYGEFAKTNAMMGLLKQREKAV